MRESKENLAPKERLNILVIEDDAILAMDLAGQVARMGHHVTGIAITAAQAIRLAFQACPDLILSDVALADGSQGPDAIHRIQEALPRVPVIFVTGYSGILSQNNGAIGVVLAKPFYDRDIARAIEQALY